MQLCDDQGSPNPDGAALSGHPTIPCKPNSDSNIYANPNPSSPRYFGLGPGQGFMELQFYPPGWAAWPAGIGCDATHWCSALNIDTFQDNENTGDFNNQACLNTVGPEPVNFAFVTNNGVATAPGNALHPEHFVPNLHRDFLMNAGDVISLHMSDSAQGFRVTLDDQTRHTQGSMTASAANGFGSVLFQPNAKHCRVQLHDFHPMYSTATPAGRNFNAAHTGNIAFADEIGHFEYCARVRHDALGTCGKPLGDDTNDPDNAGPDPQGDDVFCLPASASTRIKIGGCLNTDGDFDSVSYKFSWPGSIANTTSRPTAERPAGPVHEPAYKRTQLLYDRVRVEHQPERVQRHGVPRADHLPAAHRQPGRPASRCRLRQPAAALELLSLLHHDSGRRRLLVAAGRAVRPRHDQPVRR